MTVVLHWIAMHPHEIGGFIGTALGSGSSFWLGYRLGKKHAR